MQVNARAIQNRTQENLLWALEQDMQQFLHYLDSLSKKAESRINSIPGLRPTSPVRDSDEQGGPQTPKPSDNVVVHGVLSVDLASSDGEPLSGSVYYNSDAVFAMQEAVTVAPDEPLMENSNLHLPSSTQGDTVCFTTEDTDSLITGEHDKIKTAP